MPRKCTICHHPDRDNIDAALIERRPYRHIAAQHKVSTSALVRHSDDHIPAALVKAKEAVEVANADTILAQVQTLRDRALTILDTATAEKDRDLRIALAAIREVRGCLELLGKLAGELQDGPTINLFVSAEWMEIQGVILLALEPHAQAKLAVAAALENIGGPHVGHA